MTRRFAPALAVALAITLAACHGAPTTTHRTTLQASPAGSGRPTTPGASTGGAIALASPHATTAPTGLVSSLRPDPGTGLIANNGAGITGKVKAPASLIANNGGNVISEHGVGYRLADVVSQVPVAGATVTFRDAAGSALVDAQGHLLTATTDQAGDYILTSPLPANNVVVHVDLPGGKGSLSAIAVRPPAGQTRPPADLDVVSTLTTSYILDQYVTPQADHQGTLDKLPAGVEADTRGKAAAALSAGTVALPATLTADDAVKTMSALRQHDGALDAQLDVVRSLLVAAGQSDLGNGLPGTQVNLSAVTAVVGGATGELYLACPADSRVWRLGTDGVLHRAAGNGPTPDDDVEGKVAADVSLYYPNALAPDGAGGLVIGDRVRVLDLASDGTLHQLWRVPFVTGLGTPIVQALARGADGHVYALTSALWKYPPPPPHQGRSPVPAPSPQLAVPVALWQVDGTPRQLHAFTEAESRQLAGVASAAVAGHVLRLANGAGVAPPKPPAVDAPFEVDLASYALTQAAAPASTPWALGADGGVLALGSLASPLATAAKGLPAVLQGNVARVGGAWQTPDGTLYVATGTLVWKARGTHVEVVAGLTTLPREGDASAISFFDPEQLAATKDGHLLVLDVGTSWLWTIGPDHHAKVLRDWPDVFPPEGQPGSTSLDPRIFRVAPDGGAYLVDNGSVGTQRLLRVAPDGTMSVVLDPSNPPGGGDQVDTLYDAFVAPNGDLVLLLSRLDPDTNQTVFRLQFRPANGATPHDEPITQQDGTDANGNPLPILTPSRIAIAPDGTVYVADGSALAIWKAGQPLAPIFPTRSDDTSWSDHMSEVRTGDAARLCCDSHGRLVGTDDLGIWRFDPHSLAFNDLVGQNGTRFQGAGVDTSTGQTIANPAIDGADTLYFLDPDHHQIKRLTADQL